MLQTIRNNKNHAHLKLCTVTGHKVSAEELTLSRKPLPPEKHHTDRPGCSGLSTLHQRVLKLPDLVEVFSHLNTGITACSPWVDYMQEGLRKCSASSLAQ